MAKSKGGPLLVVGIVLVAVGLIGGFSSLALVVRLAHRDGPSEEHGSVEIITQNHNEYTTPEMPDFGLDEAGPGADDGELHDARRTDVAYGFQEGFWAVSQTEHLKAYDMDVNCVFAIKYPVLTGDLEHLDRINELLRSTAMETVRAYYEDPSSDAVDMLKKVTEGSNDYVPEGADAFLMSKVDYAVTYNDDNLLSVCYSDEYCVGSEFANFIELRTVNVNLLTGEVYVLGDALDVTEDIATSFVDNLVQMSGTDTNQNGTIEDSECSTVAIAGRAALVEAVQGKGKLAGRRVRMCLFVDGNGKPNLGVNYWVSADDAFVRGWWDVTITDEQLATARKDCGLWELLGAK